MCVCVCVVPCSLLPVLGGGIPALLLSAWPPEARASPSHPTCSLFLLLLLLWRLLVQEGEGNLRAGMHWADPGPEEGIGDCDGVMWSVLSLLEAVAHLENHCSSRAGTVMVMVVAGGGAEKM